MAKEEKKNKNKKKKKKKKKSIFLVVGILLVFGILISGNLKYIANWETAELIGYNIWSIISILGGGYLIYSGLKK